MVEFGVAKGAAPDVAAFRHDAIDQLGGGQKRAHALSVTLRIEERVRMVVCSVSDSG
jgi:hypothetical protein